jgi:hypothetical protein
MKHEVFANAIKKKIGPVRKKLLYTCSVILLLSSCITNTKYVYDDVYDSAEKPQPVDQNSGYADYIKEGEPDNQVVIDKRSSQTPLTGGYYNDDQPLAGVAGGCDCDCRYIPNSVFYNLSARTQYMWYAEREDFFGDCSCCKELFINRMEQYAMSYNYPRFIRYNGMHPFAVYGGSYGACHYLNYPTSAFGYDYASWYPYGYMYNVDPYFYGYGYTNFGNPWNTYGNSWYGNGFGNSYYGNGWSNGWFNGNSSGNSSGSSLAGNEYYGHHGHTSTGSSNTTNYIHTVKTKPVVVSNGAGDPVNEVGSNESFRPVVSNTGVTGDFNQDFSTATGGVTFTGDNSVKPTGNTVTAGRTTTHNVASNQFATGGTDGRTYTGSGGTTTTSGGTTYPNGVSTTNYRNQYSSYTQTTRYNNTSSGNTSDNSTSRNSGSSYDGGRSYNSGSSSGSSYNSGSSGSSYNSGSSGSSGSSTYGHRTSTSGGSGSSTGSTSGGGTSRR